MMITQPGTLPGPGHPDPARALAAFAAAEGTRRDAECEASGGWRSPDAQAAAHLALAATCALRALAAADPALAAAAAREVTAAWRGGALAAPLWAHCEALGLDPAAIRRAAAPPARGEARLLWPAEVAAMFQVDPKTVTRWGRRGRLLQARTLGGHRRFFAAEVDALLRGEPPERARELAEAERERMAGGGA